MDNFTHVQDVQKSLLKMSFEFWMTRNRRLGYSLIDASASIVNHTVCPQHSWHLKESQETALWISVRLSRTLARDWTNRLHVCVYVNAAIILNLSWWQIHDDFCQENVWQPTVSPHMWMTHYLLLYDSTHSSLHALVYISRAQIGKALAYDDAFTWQSTLQVMHKLFNTYTSVSNSKCMTGAGNTWNLLASPNKWQCSCLINWITGYEAQLNLDQSEPKGKV